MIGGNAMLIPPYCLLHKNRSSEGRLNLDAQMPRGIEAKLLSIINFVTVLPK